MTITTKRSIIALLISLVLVVSLFTIGISADGTDASDKGTSVETTEITESKTEAKTEANTETKAETEKVEVTETRTSLIVNGIIVGVIIIVLIVLYVKFHTKFNAFLRSVKSELKKIVWSSKENTRKGFLVVAVVAIASGIALGIADFAFSTGFDQLPTIFLKLFGIK